MALFKTKEEKLREEEVKLREEENRILKNKRFYGKVGHIPQGITTFAGFATAADNKVKFKNSIFDLYEDKLFIERTKVVIKFSDIKEIFYTEEKFTADAVIVLYSGEGIPIKGRGAGMDGIVEFYTEDGVRELKAFVNVLNRIIKEYKLNNSIPTNEVKSEDKMDRLIKLGEMYEKGLLTDEEFATMKQNLINGNNEATCSNCGAEVSADSQFCTECGTKIN